MNCRIPIFLLIVLLITSCTSNEIGNSNDVNPESIYFDYKVTGEAGDKMITILLQYRFGGVNGTTLVLEEPSKAELDGEIIKADSSKMTGAFYEIQKPMKSFTGDHRIVYTDINHKVYQEEFNFRPISLRAEVPATVERNDLVFELEGLDPVDYVRVLLTDTSFVSDGINRVDTVRNGRILVSKNDLESLVNGPIHLEFFKEHERPVRNGTREGGQLSVTYGLKRDFNLKD